MFGLSFWRHPFTAEDYIFEWIVPLNAVCCGWEQNYVKKHKVQLSFSIMLNQKLPS